MRSGFSGAGGPRGALRAGLALGMFALACLAAARCAPPAETGRRGPAVLRVTIARDILTLDPRDADDVNDHNIVRQVYEGLVDYDPRTLSVVPRLARSWSVSPDGLTWVFPLHADVRFVDDPCFPGGRGRELVADDVKFSIERGLSRYRGAAPPPDVPPLAGLAEFLGGQADAIAGLAVTGPQELTIRLSRQEPDFLHTLARARAFVTPREAVAAYGDQMRVHAVGTGPFRVALWTPLSGILLVRNPSYWGRDEQGRSLPYLDGVRLLPLASIDDERLYAEEAIDVLPVGRDYTGHPPGPESALPEVHRFAVAEQVFNAPRLSTIYVQFDFRSRHPAVRNRLLRAALSCAALRKYGRNWIGAKGLFPPGLPGFDPAFAGQRTDPGQAARLLAAAGYPGGRGLPPVRLAWRERDRDLARVIAAEFERSGFKINLQTYQDRDYTDAVRRGEVDIFRAGWIADYPAPRNFLENFVSGTPDNIGRYANPEFDRLYRSLAAEQDETRRLALARRLETILVEDSAAVFLMHEHLVHHVAARVADWAPNCTNPLGVCFYERVRLAPGE